MYHPLVSKSLLGPSPRISTLHVKRIFLSCFCDSRILVHPIPKGDGSGSASPPGLDASSEGIRISYYVFRVCL